MNTEKLFRNLIVVFACFFIGLTVACQRQETAEMSEQDMYPSEWESEEKVLNTAEGELVRVDPDREILVIRTAAGEEVEFKYDEMTLILGAGEGIEGLLTRTGTHVTVEYESGWFAKTARTVEVRFESSSQ